jgi:hypothetical protein
MFRLAALTCFLLAIELTSIPFGSAPRIPGPGDRDTWEV